MTLTQVNIPTQIYNRIERTGTTIGYQDIIHDYETSFEYEKI